MGVLVNEFPTLFCCVTSRQHRQWSSFLKTLATADLGFMGLSEIRRLAQAVEKTGKVTCMWKGGSFR